MLSKDDVFVPEAYNQYIAAVKEDDLTKALSKNTKRFLKFLKDIPKKKIDYAYAEGKWTIKELFQHLIDAERVFVIRALTFARKDLVPMPGFDENTWAAESNAADRKWKQMIDEFKTLRASTEAFFRSLNETQLKSIGTANNNQMNVTGLGFVCAGHIEHHIRIMKERYLGKIKKV